jgi:Lon protease-like protein
MEFPDRAGVMILGNCHLFPQSMLPLFIFEPRYRTMLAEALDGHRMFCLAMKRPDTAGERPCEIAGIGLVRVAVKNANGTSNLILQGISRVRLGRSVQTRPYRVHLIEPLDPEPRESLVTDALVARTLDLVDARLRLQDTVPQAVMTQLVGAINPEEPIRIETCLEALRRVEDPGALSDLIATLLLPDPMMRQIILQTVNVEERLRHLVHFLVGEVARASRGLDE